eukprot:4890655-Pyramimonas_sp.AAC.1
MLSVLLTELALSGATVLVITEIDFKTSGASCCRMQSSELGLLPELGLRNYCIVRVILRDAVGFLHLTLAIGGLQSW